MAPVLPVEKALRLWHETHVHMVLDDVPDLTTRQMAVLLTIYLKPPPHTVRGLAKYLNVTKPVITRALDTMGHLDLVARRRDEKDKRNVLIQRTVAGSLYLDQLGTMIAEKVTEEN